jgi:hypothetical protein
VPSAQTGGQPKSLYTAKLKESGLTEADAKSLGFRFLDAKQTEKLWPGIPAVPSLQLNYYSPDGKTNGFYRVRYLAKPTGFSGATEKADQRYTQPPDTAPEIYFAKGHDWPSLFSDPAVALHITEGELKAACACLNGFPTLGLGGVWSWKSAKRGEALLPAFRGIVWKERTVFITFDSDAATNPGVAQAQSALCQALTAEGAQPFIVQLPSIGDGKKTGLDDLIVALGAEAYADACAEAQPYAAARELWSMNEEVVYIRSPGLVVAYRDDLRMTPVAFTSHAYANKHYYEQKVRKDGSVALEKCGLAKAWLEWPLRSELERITYAPGQPKITPEKEYNFWKGWGCEPKRGDVTPWRELLDFMFRSEPGARKWFEQWCAAPIQQPGLKLYSAAVLWGVATGTGKSLTGYSLMKIYGDNANEINERQLASDFNEWAQNKQFVMGDDVTSKESRNSVADLLKNMVTQQMLTINAKHLPTYHVRDCINYLFNSNHPDTFSLEDFDRRFFVHEVLGPPLPRAFYQAYDKWLKREGPSALFWHLLHVDMTGFDPQAPAMETNAKRLMVLDGKSDLGSWVAKLRENPDDTLRLGPAKISGDLFTTDQLLRVYDPEARSKATANGLGRELKRAGFRQVNEGKVIATQSGPKRLYAIRNQTQWLKATPKTISLNYDASRNPQEKPKKF